MTRDLRAVSYRKVVFLLACVAVVAAIIFVPELSPSRAASGAGSLGRTESHEPGLPNYDIRTDKGAIDTISALRSRQDTDASRVADVRDQMVRGESSLKQRVPTLRVEYNDDIRIPEVIGPDVRSGAAILARGSGNRADTLRNFLNENRELVGARTEQISDLRVASDYTNPDGNLSFVSLEQAINGIPVFRGEVKAGFTKRGEMFRVINNFAPGLDYSRVRSDFGDPLDAVRSALRLINNDGSKLDLTLNGTASTDLKTVFGKGDWATTAEKMYFPTEPGVAVPAWRVLVWQPVNAYYVIIDAESHAMLWRKNIGEDQTQAASYNVYANPNAMINVADNPFPMTPGTTSPNGVQGTGIPRTMVTLVGNEAPYQFNNNGWITDGNNTTDGNAVEAGLDRDDFNSANGVDANGIPAGTSRVFDFPFTPGIPTNPAQNQGDSPLPAGSSPAVCAPAGQSPAMIDFQRAAVTQLFYISNRIHDELYRLGFTEEALNFQHDNFGRGGLGNDRVSAEAQDCSGTNNANFNTPADGGRGRMQMYLWTGPAPDFDGDLDADVIVHEYLHGMSNRLHGNSAGLSTTMSRGMGEGWGDFYGHAMLSEASDPINGIYTTGAYDTYRGGPGFNNYYYGIRRFPKAVKAFTGGPNDRPHNPLTFADIDATQLNITDGAYPPRFNSTADQVHAAGEIWSSALWEVRAKYVQRLGWAVGNRRTLQYVTDGMKLAPFGPTFLAERDAIIAAALASGSAEDVADLWSGFAIRGMGFSASVQTAGTGSGTARVTEAFDLPNLLQTPALTVSDAPGDNDGAFEPGEPVIISVPLTNITGVNATNVALLLEGAGGGVSYGPIAHGSTVSRDIPYTIPANTECGSALALNFIVDSNLGSLTFSRTIQIGAPNTTFTEAFDTVTAPAFPDGWTAVSISGGINFVTTATSPDSGTLSAFAQDPTSVGGGTDLTSPSMAIGASAALVSFRNKWDTEPGWDGGVLEISIGGGPFQDILTAGGVFVENGYNGSLGVGTNNPLNGRNAWTGDSGGGYVTTVVRLPASAEGQNVQLKFRFGADNNTAATGWFVDTIRVSGTFTCETTPTGARADFDGDGKTDISVYRPSEGNWYLDRSRDGFVGLNFGLAEDIATPGDFDGDGKTDVAVFRPSTGTWFRLNSGDGTPFATNFGLAGDIPQPGDFDGDGLDDIAIFRPSDGTWYWQNSSNGSFGGVQFGLTGDLPVAGDYDGDGKDDIAVCRPHAASQTWYRINSGNGEFAYGNFGFGPGKPVHADFDGDGREDMGLFHNGGTWYWQRSSNGQSAQVTFGLGSDVPVPGDYDGDGKDDQAVYRDGVWYLNRSTAGVATVPFGLPADVPIPNKYIP